MPPISVSLLNIPHPFYMTMLAISAMVGISLACSAILRTSSSYSRWEKRVSGKKLHGMLKPLGSLL